MSRRKRFWPDLCPFCMQVKAAMPAYEQLAAGYQLTVVDRHSECNHIITYRGRTDWLIEIRRAGPKMKIKI